MKCSETDTSGLGLGKGKIKPILKADYTYDESGNTVTLVELMHIGPDYDVTRIENPTKDELNEINEQLISQL